MKTEITELLGIRYPIIQGGMAWVADYHLAAAVSNAKRKKPFVPFKSGTENSALPPSLPCFARPLEAL